MNPISTAHDLDQLLACFGLHRLLPQEEQAHLKRELFEMIEAESFMDRFRSQLDS
jgi:hypothetical protein